MTPRQRDACTGVILGLAGFGLGTLLQALLSAALWVAAHVRVEVR